MYRRRLALPRWAPSRLHGILLVSCPSSIDDPGDYRIPFFADPWVGRAGTTTGFRTPSQASFPTNGR